MRYHRAYSYERHANTVLVRIASGRGLRLEARRAKRFEYKVCAAIVLITAVLCFYLAFSHV